MSDDPRARAEARIGSVLNEKWTLQRLLGLGGMAAVYAGRHRNGARGAVKLLHPELSRSPEIRERFLREGYAANRVEHPGAVAVLDDDVVTSGPDAGTAYLIMELLEGESLEDRMRRRPGPFSEEEALAIAEGVLDVLIAAHAHGVIHRDIKPENVFLASGEANNELGFERVKLLDFGLARIAHGELVTQSGMALGTPSFMAPEQAEGRAEEIDGRTDLFGLGANLFRILTGKKLHEAPNVLELVTKMAKVPAPPVRSARQDLSDTVASIVDRALKFRREDRYPDAAAMRADVRAARTGQALPSVLGTAVTQINEVVTPPPASAAVSTKSPQSRRDQPSQPNPSGSSPIVETSPASTTVKPVRSGSAFWPLLAVASLVVIALFLGGYITREGVARWYRTHVSPQPSTPVPASAASAPSPEPSSLASVETSASASVAPSSEPAPSVAASSSASAETIDLDDLSDAGPDAESTDASDTDAGDAKPAASAPKPAWKGKPRPPHPKWKKKK